MEGAAYEAHQIIYNLGDPSSHFYVVVSGEVELWELLTTSDGQLPTAGSSAVGSAKQTSSIGGDGAAASVTSQKGGGGSRGGEGASVSGGGGLRARTAGVAAGASSSGKSSRAGSRGGARGGDAAAGAAGGAAEERMATRVPGCVEVRRVKPRECFGEDDLADGSARKQTARAAAAGGAAAAAGERGGIGRSVTVKGGAAGKAAEAGAGAPVVVLALAADEWMKILQGRMSRMQEDKVRGRGCLRCAADMQLPARSVLEAPCTYCMHEALQVRPVHRMREHL